MSEAIRAADPNAVIIHGGASVPRRPAEAADFCKSNPAIDFLVFGEGERALQVLVDALREGCEIDDLSSLPGVGSAMGAELSSGVTSPGAVDLDDLPSPYLMGVFDSVIEGCTSATIESDRGCPHGCAFCDWGAATASRVRHRSLELVRDEVRWLSEHGIRRLDIANANFGAFDRDIEVAALIAQAHKRTGALAEVGLSFAKNDITRTVEILRVFAAAGVSLSAKNALQTTATGPLKAIKRRNLPLSQFQALNRELASLGYGVGTDIMVGLPGATVADIAHDLGFCISEDIPASTTPVVLLPNAPMSDPNYIAAYGIQTDEHDWVVASSTFTRGDFELMRRMVRIYQWIEIRGILRVALRFIHDDGGIEYSAMLHSMAVGPLPVSARFIVADPGTDSPSTPACWATAVEELVEYLLPTGTGSADTDIRRQITDLQVALIRAATPRPVSFDAHFDLAAWWETRSNESTTAAAHLGRSVIQINEATGAGKDEPPTLHQSVFSLRSPSPTTIGPE
jgi:hypothetical protein